MRSCWECWVWRDGMWKEWGSGRDLSQHSFSCAGIESAVSEQEGRGLRGEEGWGRASRQNWLCNDILCQGITSHNQVLHNSDALNIFFLKDIEEKEEKKDRRTHQVSNVSSLTTRNSGLVVNGRWGVLHKILHCSSFSEKKKLGQFLFKGRAQIELLNNQGLYNDWPPLDSSHHSSPVVPSPYCHFSPLSHWSGFCWNLSITCFCDAYNV